jgi:NAD/NADP transhydrogenase alpha subunit
MPVKIAVLKETRANERRVALVPAVADKLVKLGAEIHMQSSAGDAVKLPDSAFKNVSFAANPQGLVSDADIVLAVQPLTAELVNAMKKSSSLKRCAIRRSPASRWSWCRASPAPRRWTRSPAKPHSPAITPR